MFMNNGLGLIKWYLGALLCYRLRKITLACIEARFSVFNPSFFPVFQLQGPLPWLLHAVEVWH